MTDIYICMYVCICRCICIYIYLYDRYVYIYTYIYTPSIEYVIQCIMNTYIYIDMYMYMYMYMRDITPFCGRKHPGSRRSPRDHSISAAFQRPGGQDVPSNIHEISTGWFRGKYTGNSMGFYHQLQGGSGSRFFRSTNPSKNGLLENPPISSRIFQLINNIQFGGFPANHV